MVYSFYYWDGGVKQVICVEAGRMGMLQEHVPRGCIESWI